MRLPHGANALVAGALAAVVLAVATTSCGDDDGGAATATYDVGFGGKPQYRDLTGKLQRVAGAWSVSRDEFCSFMSSARTPCP